MSSDTRSSPKGSAVTQRALARGLHAHQILLLLAAGVLLRLLVHLTGTPAEVGDPRAYTALAESLRSGHGLVFSEEVYGPNQRGVYPPLYPLLLAIFVSPLALNTILDLLTAKLMLRMESTGIAAVLFFLFPSMILSAPVAQKESLLILIALSLMVVAIEQRRAWLFGLLSGLLLLTQPALLLFPPALCVIFLNRKSLRWFVTAVITTLVVLCSWWVRNWIVLGSFVPFTTSAGLQIAVIANGGQHISPPNPELPEVERFSLAGRLAWERLELLPYMFDQWQRIMRAIFLEYLPLPRIYPGAPLLAAYALTLSWLILLVAALRCSDKTLRRAFIAGVIGILLAVPLEFGERHRAHLLPLLCLMATVGRSRLSRAEVGSESLNQSSP